jgi:hypothetical protein
LLATVSLILGFLFVVVIYLLEYPHEALTMWGVSLTMFLVFCYIMGLCFILFMIRFEITYYLINRASQLDSARIPRDKHYNLFTTLNNSLKRGIQCVLLFFFSFGLFLINLGGFSVAKIYFVPLSQLDTQIALLYGDIVLNLLHMAIMFFTQLILIIPFSWFIGGIWDNYKIILNLEADKETRSR